MDSQGTAIHRRSAVSLGLLSGLVLWAALALSAIDGSSSASISSTTFAICNGTKSSIGDGECELPNNNAECGYDGGDCCKCTCVSTASFTCGSNGFTCLDPEAGDSVLGCELVTIQPPEVSPCAAGTPQHWVVKNTADADSLADGILCSGGSFEVEWKGYVSVNRTLYAIDGTVLDVVGVADAVADGGGISQLFSAFNGTLRVSDLQLSKGAGIHGGAIYATQQSEVTLTRVKFASNTAHHFGGAVHLDSSSLELASGSTFTGNSAIHGGAIYMASSSTLVQQVGSGEIYRFIDNNATDGGALYVSRGSTFAGANPKNSMNTSSYATPSYENNYFTFGATFAQTCYINNTAQGSGGAVYIDDMSLYYWLGETTFEENSADYGGAFFVGGLQIVQWQGVTVFARNRAQMDGGAVASAIVGHSPFVFFNGSVSFLNNTCGRSGGALAFSGHMDLRWGDTAPEFSGNFAAFSGGAVYISEPTSGHQFIDARFAENRAQNGGAVLAAGCGTDQTTSPSGATIFHPTNFSNCTFVGNSGREAGGAIEIRAGRAHVENSKFVGNIARNGGALRLSGTVNLLDSSFFDNTSIEGGGLAISNSGILLEMNGLIFSDNLLVCASTEYVDFYNYSRSSNQSYLTVCQDCDTPCQRCFFDNYMAVQECAPLFPHAHSEGGTATIERVIVEKGYWRADVYSKTVLPCYNDDACLGGLTGRPGYCNDGYEGPYCSVCSKGYGATLAFRCRQCSDGNSAVIVVVLAIAILAAVAFLWHMVSIEDADSTRGVVVRVENVLPLQSIKIVLVAWQIVAQFSSLAHVIYPEAYQRLLDVVALANFDMGWALSAACMVDVDFYDGLLMATIGPVVLVCILRMTYTVAIYRNRHSKAALTAVRCKHLGVVVFLTFVVYASVSSIVLRSFQCDDLDNGKHYLKADYRIECGTPRHKTFQIYAGLMVLLYPVGIPMFYTILLFREHKTLGQELDHDTPRYEAMSTLRKPYRASVFYYEVVECSRRFLLTCAMVFVYPGSAVQIAVTTAIVFTFVLVSEGLHPYASRWDAWVSRAGNTIVLLSMYIAILLRLDFSNEHVRDQDVYSGVLVAAHAIMIVLVIFETMALLLSMTS